ncbi:hypothetical protein KIH74_22865 [Kineosporia sp. J2-2]|uniref:SGNH/GDSL hydrolase family protein n=1 Tax=Kineosporia corallincola TaxID=2835133 RepID=A0ABS5TL43_9ACTN|nr:hypothetical protein [Kineosporia corallincola]MBT0771801.1 hypothetical protein [Kineosporia corallincola]
MSLPPLTRSQATKSFSARQVPPGVASMAGAWDAGRSVYNLKPKHLTRLRAAAGKACAGVTGEYNINFIGDSITVGSGIGSPYDYGERNWPSQLRKAFLTRGLSAAGEGYVIRHNGGAQKDARFTEVGTWSTESGVPTLVWKTNSGSGATLTYTSTNSGTIVEVIYADTTADFTVSIDGAAPVTITRTNTQVTKVYRVTGLANTTHTVVFGAVTTGGTYFCSVRVRTATALNFNSFAHFGAQASTFGSPTSQPFGTLKCLNDNVPAAATFISLMTNEVAGASPVTAATYKTNLNALIGYLSSPGDIILCAAIPGNVAADYSAHRQALYEIADARDLPVVDFYPRFVDGTTMAANGLLSDTVHPTAPGYFDMAQLVATAIL